jgi:hypothetical protein
MFMNLHRALFFCVLFIVLSACVSSPDLTPTQRATRLVTGTSTPAAIKTDASPTPSAVPIVTTIPFEPTRRPQINPIKSATQAIATVEMSQVVWSGTISPTIFQQVINQEPGDREAFAVPESDVVFNPSTQPVIIAAYIYEVPGAEKYHARFLLYERGGKWEGEVIPPFLYKMDLPLSQIGTHNDYGDYNQIIRNLETQFENPIVPNKLRIAVFSANTCLDTRDVYQQLCEELARQNVELPVDYKAAEAMVLDQWKLAIQQTATKIVYVEQMIGSIGTIGTDWWEDDRFVLFYLAPITICLPEDQQVCGTYTSYEMLIDPFLVPR